MTLNNKGTIDIQVLIVGHAMGNPHDLVGSIQVKDLARNIDLSMTVSSVWTHNPKSEPIVQGRYVMAQEECFIMAETEPTQTEQETKTAADLQLEKLNARLDSLETSYQARIKELEEANRGLWAQLHPVTETVTAAPAPDPAPAEPQEDKAEAALFDALGMKKEA